MYIANPIGINIKENDGEVKDGFLHESINLQWRNGAFRPIPERLISDINAAEYTKIILHKVSDEDQINVLGFRAFDPIYLAEDLAQNITGNLTPNGNLEWFGKIVNGVYTSITPVDLGIANTSGLSFTILNGLIYFMGDGSSTIEQYYVRLQYNESDEAYELKDMYAWKSLIPFYPIQSTVEFVVPDDGTGAFDFTFCGIIAVRFTLVLNSGEEVLHSPIYGFSMFGIMRTDTSFSGGDTIKNIHTVVNLDLDFADTSLLADEISSINVYASTPYYVSEITQSYIDNSPSEQLVDASTIKGELQKKAEEPFYLVKTIDKPTTDKLLLVVGELDTDITYSFEASKVDISTIAAGEIMPVDNFTYHRIYGKITSYNGRLIIDKPTTILSNGHIRSLSTEDVSSDVGFRINTEDGRLNGIAYRIDKALEFNDISGLTVRPRGILSYPDTRVNIVGGSNAVGNSIRLFKCRKNKLHNVSCAFGFHSAGWGSYGAIGSVPQTTTTTQTNYHIYVIYEDYDELTAGSHPIIEASYRSENRDQFSAAGEFSVFPALNSYRVGEGKIVVTGTNNVNPTDADITAPLYVGTTDGLYTINFDQSGTNLVANITRRAKLPFISEEVLQIGDAIVFVSDKGLMVFSGGEVINLTQDYFPDQGNGEFPDLNTILPNYNTLVFPYFGVGGNPYQIDDIVTYMKGAKMAYDGRRNTIWCSNPSYNFSLIYSLDFKVWGMSTFVFSERQDFNALINTSIGDVYSRFLVRQNDFYQNNLVILSGEDFDQEVIIHLLTRPIKLQNPDVYKKIRRLITRCELFRDEAATGYFTYGVWGKQDHNKKKPYIPIAAYFDARSDVFPNNVRQDIPSGRQKGKYKDISILVGGKVLPDSSITGFEFDALLVDDKNLR